MNEKHILQHAIERHNNIRQEAEKMRLVAIAAPVHTGGTLRHILSFTGRIFIAVGTRLQREEQPVQTRWMTSYTTK